MNQQTHVAERQASPDREAELLARIGQGDRRAFEALYKAYYRRLTRFLDKITRQPQLIEEILDDTMFAVWQGAARFHGASRASTWIFGIAYNVAMKAIGRERRHASQESADELPTDAVHEGPEADLIARESEQMLTALLGGLSPEHRAVIELTYYFGYSYAEIASIVDCPVDTVKTRMFYARRKLRVLLEARGGRP